MKAAVLRTALFRLQHRYAPYFFVAPFLVVFVVFMLYPLVNSFVLALYVTSGPKSKVFVGLANFFFLLRDPDFHTAVKNTVVYATCSVFLQLPLSLGLATNRDIESGTQLHAGVRKVVEAADRAVYSAKASGRNRVIID